MRGLGAVGLVDGCVRGERGCGECVGGGGWVWCGGRGVLGGLYVGGGVGADVAGGRSRR